jgi:hypothetical protein
MHFYSFEGKMQKKEISANICKALWNKGRFRKETADVACREGFCSTWVHILFMPVQ